MFSSNDNKSSPSEDEHNDDESWVPPIEKSVKPTKGVKRPAETINDEKKLEFRTLEQKMKMPKKFKKLKTLIGQLAKKQEEERYHALYLDARLKWFTCLSTCEMSITGAKRQQ